MSRDYVLVPSERIENLLVSKGFNKTVEGHEIKYIRPSIRNKRAGIVVYTSITDGAENARSSGSDAIRIIVRGALGKLPSGAWNVCTLYAKLPIVKRMGTVDGVLLRMEERILTAEEWIENRVATINCDDCGSLLWNNSYKCMRETWTYVNNKGGY